MGVQFYVKELSALVQQVEIRGKCVKLHLLGEVALDTDCN